MNQRKTQNLSLGREDVDSAVWNDEGTVRHALKRDSLLKLGIFKFPKCVIRNCKLNLVQNSKA